VKAYAAMGLLHAGIAVALRAAGGFTPMTSSSSTSTKPRPLPAMAAATGAVIAVGAAYVLRGPANVEEASAAEGQPLHRVT
jgi:hypothetical protein